MTTTARLVNMSKVITAVEIDENADVCSVLHLLASEVGWTEVLLLATECAYEEGTSYDDIYTSVADALYISEEALKEPRGYA